MVNITLSIPEGLYKRMKKHPEVKWSEIARRAIAEHLERLEESAVILSAEALRRRVERDTGIRLEQIPVSKAEEYYKKMREFEWRRTYSTQTS